MTEPLLVLELVKVVPSGGRCVGGLDEETSDGHGREEGANAEERVIKQIAVDHVVLLLEPVGRGDPQDQAEGGRSGDRAVGLCEPGGVCIALGEIHCCVFVDNVLII